MFEALEESNQKGEFFGSFCHWHLCTTGKKRGQVTIREIIVEQANQGKGIGRKYIELLKETPGATSLFASCPADLPSNGFYEKLGFVKENSFVNRNGRTINQWRLTLS